MGSFTETQRSETCPIKNSPADAKTFACVTGHGRYTADVTMDKQAAAYFLRGDRAHAKIRGIDTAKARSAPGVIDIVTGADMAAAGWKGLPAMAFFKGVGGSLAQRSVPRRGLRTSASALSASLSR